jgi:hypothetical protein
MSFLHGSRLSKHLAPKSERKPLISPKSISMAQLQQGNNGNYGLKPMSHEPAPMRQS